MELSSEILSNITIFNKYSKYISKLNRRETWEEICIRYENMMIEKYPMLKDEILSNMSYIKDKKILPSMRAMQFAGPAIFKNNSRLYNCAYFPIDSYESFSEAMFLLLGGTGVGYSVQFHHIAKLPEISKPNKERKFLVGDSLEGWADSIKALMKSYFGITKYKPRFDFSDIRPKGARLVTAGGKAPGSGPLKECLVKIENILDNKKNGDKLSTLECHDIMCHIANAVLSGGIRRSAMIALFSFDDYEMLECKYGNWWELNEQRGRANNSAVILRSRIKKNEFSDLWKKIELSGSGEPGIYFTNDVEFGTNPCQPSWATVITPKGLSTIGDISEGDYIWSETGWTKVIKKWSTGIKKVNKYQTTSGIFYGTENHRLISNGIKIEAKDCASIDSLRGPDLKIGYYNFQDVVDGLVIGDGSMHKASNNKIYLNIGKNDQDYFKSSIKDYIKEKLTISKYSYNIKTTINYLDYTFNRSIPIEFFSSTEKLKGFLKGLYSANGSFTGSRVTFKTTSTKMRDDLQLALSYLGIKSYYTKNKPNNIKFNNGNYICKESYDINISTDIYKFNEKIGFLQEYKNKKVLDYLNRPISKYSFTKDKNSYKVVNVEFVSEEEVFDITVDNTTHTYWTGGLNVSNCAEIALRPFSFCNLCEINVSDVESQDDLNKRAIVTSFFGTLQAGFTDFHYLRPIWQQTTEKDALIGVGMTGIASGNILSLNLKDASKWVKDENRRVSNIIGINESARTTTIKPSGTTSCVLGTSSGIHAWHNDYYIRRIRIMKNDPLYTYLLINHEELVEDDKLRSHDTAIISIPQKASKNSILRTESVFDLLERVKKFNLEWIKPGHRRGNNNNNVSATISIKEHQWLNVGTWMWENRKTFNGLSVLPYSNHTYVQAPFEDITEDQYNNLFSKLKEVDLSKVIELDDNTEHTQEIACAGGKCEI